MYVHLVHLCECWRVQVQRRGFCGIHWVIKKNKTGGWPIIVNRKRNKAESYVIELCSLHDYAYEYNIYIIVRYGAVLTGNVHSLSSKPTPRGGFSIAFCGPV